MAEGGRADGNMAGGRTDVRFVEEEVRWVARGSTMEEEIKDGNDSENQKQVSESSIENYVGDFICHSLQPERASFHLFRRE